METKAIDDIPEVWEQRFSAMDANHMALQKDIADLARDLAGLTAAVKSVTSNVEVVSKTQSQSLRTNWGVVFSGVGVLILIAGLVIYRPLNQIVEDHLSHIKDGHPESVKTKMRADNALLSNRLDRKKEKLDRIENKLDQLTTDQTSLRAKLLFVERNVYRGNSIRDDKGIISSP